MPHRSSARISNNKLLRRADLERIRKEITKHKYLTKQNYQMNGTLVLLSVSNKTELVLYPKDKIVQRHHFSNVFFVFSYTLAK